MLIARKTHNMVVVSNVKIPKKYLKNGLKLSLFNNRSKKLINFPTQIIGCPIEFISTFGQPKKMSIQTEKKIIKAIFIKSYDNNILN